MGDTGSLMLGGVMLTIAWLIREELILASWRDFLG